MHDTHEFEVHFPPRTPRVAAATSGQVFIHDVLRGLSPNNGHTNFEIGLFIPQRSLIDIEINVSQLLREIESLRTIFYNGIDGRLVQELLTTANVRMLIVNSTPHSDIRNAHRVEPFAPGDLPVRIFLYTAASELYLSFVVSHLSIDKWGRDVLQEHLERLFLGADWEPSAQWHPIDQSLFEQSEPAQRTLRQSEAYWRSTLGQFPVSIIEGAKAHSSRSLWWRVQLNSPSLGVAVAKLAHQAGVSSSVVALTLSAIVIGTWFDIDKFHTMMLSANRLDRRCVRAIGAYAQTVPISLATDANTFAQLARENFGAALRAYQHSSVSPYVSREILNQLDLGGTPKSLDTMTNVYILGSAHKSAIEPPADADADDSIINWVSSRESEITNVSFDCSEPGMALLQADTKYIPKNDIEKLLRLYRHLALRLAVNDVVPPRELANMLFDEM